ncbi:hypothetical protein GGR54DRAFT_559880 [Hypoxylon sp. NC1633]|nr:hypothetical protein GGR54DRAFT_559880 [Hypoxylon sp. NC1633]
MDNRQASRSQPYGTTATPGPRTRKRQAPTPTSSNRRNKRARRVENQDDEADENENEDAERDIEPIDEAQGEAQESHNDDEDEQQDEALQPKKRRKGRGDNSVKWSRFKESIIAGAEDLPGTLLGFAGKLTAELGRRAATYKSWVRTHRPAVDIEELMNRLPRAEDNIDELWTQEKEDELLERFERDPLRAYMATTRTSNVHDQFWAMWRKACNLRKVFPTDIIGAKEYLEYGEGVIEVSEGVHVPDPHWIRGFCVALDFLIVASPCRGDMGLLGLFIRYAVACRINDRRQVPLDESGLRCAFFKFMKQAMKSSDGSTSLREIGVNVRRLWVERGLPLPWEALVLKQIEKSVGDSEAEPVFQEEGAWFQPYAVCTADLKCVNSAFRNVTDIGYPMFSNMDEVFTVLSNARAAKDAPKKLKELMSLRLPLLLADMRIWEKRHLAELGEPSQGGDDDDDDDVFVERSRPLLNRPPTPGVALSGRDHRERGAGDEEDQAFPAANDDDEDIFVEQSGQLSNRRPPTSGVVLSGGDDREGMAHDEENEEEQTFSNGGHDEPPPAPEPDRARLEEPSDDRLSGVEYVMLAGDLGLPSIHPSMVDSAMGFGRGRQAHAAAALSNIRT